MGRTFFITGATGLVGGSIASRLLKEGNRVFCLARNRGTKNCRERVFDALSFWGDSDFQPDDRNLKVFEGDVEEDRFGLNRRDISELKDSGMSLIHSAACTSFDPRDRAITLKTNLEGTRNMIETAKETGAREINYISTAYVAGTFGGSFSEDDFNAGQLFNNVYEESKYEAEKIVRRFNEQTKVRVNIFRPSIIMGDTVSGKTSNFNGLYAYIRAVSVLVRKKRNPSAGAAALRFECRSEVTKNIVPIDFVSRAISAIVRAEADPGLGVYQLTNPAPPTFGWLNEVVHGIIGIPPLKLVPSLKEEAGRLSRAEVLIKNSVKAYTPYFFSEPSFNSSRTLAALAARQLLFPQLDTEYFSKIISFHEKSLNNGENRHLSLIGLFEKRIRSSIGTEIIPGLTSLTQDFILSMKDTGVNYYIRIEKGVLKKFAINAKAEVKFRFVTKSSTFEELLRATIRPQEAFLKKLVEIEGSVLDALSLSTVFEKFFKIFREEADAAGLANIQK